MSEPTISLWRLAFRTAGFSVSVLSEANTVDAVDKKSRRSQAEFVCVSCGFGGHADVNAAKVLLKRRAGPSKP